MPAGAVPDGNGGVNFSIFSQNASRVQLLLFNSSSDIKPFAVFDLDKNINYTAFYWHIFVHDAGPGVYYAYRIGGPDAAVSPGARFDFDKTLIDPYSRVVSMKRWVRESAIGPGDNLFKSMRSVVAALPAANSGALKRPNLKRSEMILYELHPSGFTKSGSSGVLHPGTFSGVIEKIEYFKHLGVNAVIFLPVTQFDDISALRYAPDGSPIKNYWGHSTIALFAPHSRYVSRPADNSHLIEFRSMIDAFHSAGIEVIMDITLDHSDEGGESGPMFSYKGIDNAVYYRLAGEKCAALPRSVLYEDPAACGNAFDCAHPAVRRMIIDCLEFWASEMGVDGFRLGGVSVLTAGAENKKHKYSPLLWDIRYSRKLEGTKFFVKDMDISLYDARNNFPGEYWSFFNVDFKNDIRRFVKGEAGLTAKIASRIAGSADIYEKQGYGPQNIVNYITSHDGFTLNDLVSYNQKHNYENGEGNRDGAGNNYSWNCSIEGPDLSGAIDPLRVRQIKNFAVILFMSQGTPMLLYGDEARRTQNGNNNAYCQDNPAGWFDWGLIEKNKEVYDFFQKLIEFRKSYKILHRRAYFNGARNGRGLKDISWHACALDNPGFDDPASRALAFTLGAPDDDSDIHVIMNMYWEPLEFQMPLLNGRGWYRLIDTYRKPPLDIALAGPETVVKTPAVEVNGRSVAVFVSR